MRPAALSHRLLVATGVLLGSRLAHAESAAPVEVVGAAALLRLPLAEAERPLVLPPFILSSSLEFDIVRVDSAASYADLTGQVSFGLSDDLSVRALVLPLQLSGPAGNGFHYGQTAQTRGPSLGATYRLRRGVVEVGVSLDLRVFTSEDVTGGAIIPTIPIRIHASRRVRVDVNPQLNITRGTQTAAATEIVNAGGDNDVETASTKTSINSVRFALPVTLTYNVVEPFFVAVNSGVTVDHIDEPSSSTHLPLGFALGYSVAGREGPILDIGPSLNFPYLLTPGAKSSTDGGEYVIGLTALGYFYL